METIKFVENKANTIFHKCVLLCDCSYPVRFFNFHNGFYSKISTSFFLLDQTSNFKKSLLLKALSMKLLLKFFEISTYTGLK